MNLPDVFLYALAASLALNVYWAVMVSHYKSFAPATPRLACAKCGYDVRTTIDGHCPECGTPVPARTERPRRAITRCSFCGRSNQETDVQVEGPGDVYICAPCVRHANWMLEEHAAKQAPPPEPPK